MKTLLRTIAAASAFPSTLILTLAFAQAPRCFAQTVAPSDAPARVAVLHEAIADTPSERPAPARDPATSDIVKELAAMKARIEVLEAELKSRTAPTEASPALEAPPTMAALPIAAAAPAQPRIIQPEIVQPPMAQSLSSSSPAT